MRTSVGVNVEMGLECLLMVIEGSCHPDSLESLNYVAFSDQVLDLVEMRNAGQGWISQATKSTTLELRLFREWSGRQSSVYGGIQDMFILQDVTSTT